ERLRLFFEPFGEIGAAAQLGVQQFDRAALRFEDVVADPVNRAVPALADGAFDGREGLGPGDAISGEVLDEPGDHGETVPPRYWSERVFCATPAFPLPPTSPLTAVWPLPFEPPAPPRPAEPPAPAVL